MYRLILLDAAHPVPIPTTCIYTRLPVKEALLQEGVVES